jgi:hypothetical protein
MRQRSPEFRSADWKRLFLAALFENNKASVPMKIAEAQRALKMRRSELLNRPPSDAKEIQAVDTALFSLNALRNCLAISGSVSPVA